MEQVQRIQEDHLNELRKKKTKVKVFLMNGYPAQGIIVSFDPFCLLLKDGEKQHLIYKHAISTIEYIKVKDKSSMVK